MMFHLTPREKQIAELISQGFQNKEIAYQLHLSEGTVKVYNSRIYRQYGVRSRVEFVIRWQERKAIYQNESVIVGTS